MRHHLALAAAAIGLLGAAPAALAAPISYVASLSGSAEVPPNASPGAGTARLTIDTIANFISYDVSFWGLLGTTFAAHVHGPAPAGVNGGVASTTPAPPGFPLGVTAGSFSGVFDTTLASTYSPPFLTANGGTPEGAEAAFAQMLADGNAYFNIHTTVFAGGEIRGQFGLAPIPLPAGAVLIVTALGALGALRLRRVT
ncbi:CHRD domain-containing protein [Roseitranquillus sediminis]|uniref:CHRD domain-containing protein n=1 Tax=Roseitranquillus sediminis TaxID=2809051 RepID=UPI001D0C5093|nr:CHRD domain-containing protein [Roseitranquillus sediminis]MBM9594300.1 CHRD domain-containing protein [Roseitranquillus sediminis]